MENNQQPTDPNTAATTQPPTEAPPAPAEATTPPENPAPAAAATTEQPETPPAEPKPRTNEMRIPVTAFRQRVKREAESFVAKALGMPLEQAQANLKKLKDLESGLVEKEAHANEAVERLRQENQSLQRRLQKALNASEELKRKQSKEVRRLKDRQIESDLLYRAKAAGMADANYGVHLFAKAAAAKKASDPSTYFDGLKKTHPHLFKGGASTEPVVAVNTAPPRSSSPDGAPPRPSAQGTSAAKTADDMDAQEFSSHARSRYGYTPGA